MGSPFLPRVLRERAPNYEGLGTGWPAMARIVREIDEQKIQNYKDDIDTILVFAGLFSGVMTAFLVESYHNLSPDPTQMMILLMRQLTTQTHSYTINGGFLNSTAPPLPDAPPPEFTPTVNAIRVNVLWFASLTLSLMSASFSILVKQWLQEYLAGEYTSPQARIRIRHFRYPGLDDWKVFEIAAALPLFLQLSLALFFIGLCFFTADVHSTVGHTTLPLVAAWGFLFIIVSLAPALSPRCPYKTRLLKSVVKDMRKIVLQLVLWVKNMSYRDLSPFTEVAGGLWSYQLLAYDEEDAVTTDKNDVDIFISVDSIQSDEALLQAMWHALQQTEPNPADAFTFILNIISHRVPQRVVVAPDAVLDLKRVPKPTVTAIMDMTAETVRDVLNRQPHSVAATDVTEWQAWLRSCVYIVLAETDAPVLHAVKEILAPLLADKIWYRALFDTIKSCFPDPDAFPALLDRLSPALALADRATTLDILAYLMQCYFCDKDDVAHSHNTAVDILDAHPDLSPRHREAITKFIFPLMTKDLDLADYPKWAFAERRLILYLYSYTGDRRTEIVEFVRLLLTTWANISLIISVAVGMHIDTSKSLRDNAQAVFVDAAATCTSDVIPNVLKNLVWYAERYTKRAAILKEDESTKSYTMDPLLGCLVFMRILKALRDKGLSLDEYSTSIRGFWSGVDEGLQALAGSRDLWQGDYPASAQECLNVVNELDSDLSLPSDAKDEEAFIAWTKAFPADKSLFSDQLIKNISLFLPSEVNQGTMFGYRMRRLQILEKQNVNEPSSEDSNGYIRPRTGSHSSEQALQMASSSRGAQKASSSVVEGSSNADKDTTGFDPDSRRPEPNALIEETEMAAAVGVKEREPSNDAATVADISVNPDHWLPPLSPASNSLSSDHGTVVTPSGSDDS